MGKVRNINEVINDKSMKVFLKKNINDKSMMARIAQTDYTADKLVKIFSSPQSRRFFLKCAWNLSEDTIWTAVENSNKRHIKCPIKYFVTICSKELRNRTTA